MPTRTTTPTLEDEFSAALPTTEAGRLMADRGYDKEALRHDNCGKIVPRRCAQGHIDRRLKLMCANRFCCLTCAEKWGLEKFEEWKESLETSIRFPDFIGDWSTYLEIEAPCPRTQYAIRDLVDDWTDELAYAGYPSHWDRLVGMRGNNLVIRILIPNTTGEECREEWAEMFPGARITIQVIRSWQILYVFKNRLLETIIPDTVREQVDQWELFRRMHMFRAPGLHPSAPLLEVEDFFVEEIPPTEMSPEDSPDSPPDFHLCQTCHQKFTHKAKAVDAFSPPQTWVWEPIPEKHPPGDP